MRNFEGIILVRISVLSRPRNGSEGVYGYKVNNVNSKNKISVFLLAFFYFTSSEFLYQHLNYYIFSRIIPNQITENININWYWYLCRNCLDIEMFDSFRKLLFVWRTLLIKRLFYNLMENKKKTGMSDKYV